MPGCIISLPWCSHGLAPLYFIESILSTNAFRSSNCGSWPSACCQYGVLCSSTWTNYMGFRVNTALTGNFYLKTNSKSPYSQSTGSSVYYESYFMIAFVNISILFLYFNN